MRGDRLSGHCLTAQLAEDEQVTLVAAIEEAHGQCPRAHIQGNGTVWACACECHAATPHCPRCGAVGVESGAHSVEECSQVIMIDLTARDNHLVSHDITGAIKKALGPDVRVDVPKKPQKPRKTQPESGKGACEHCGQPTGGRFAVGHDSKLKSQLRQEVNEGGGRAVEALAELIMRNWTKAAGSLDINPDIQERAEEIAAHSEAEAWLRRRVKERIDVAS